MLDANIIEPGEEFEKLPETYVIFITENDAFGWTLLIYHIDRTIHTSLHIRPPMPRSKSLSRKRAIHPKRISQ